MCETGLAWLPSFPTRRRSRRSRASRVRGLDAPNHARETEIWLRIYKKDTGKPTVTSAEALDVALCWGWIDGIRKALDDESFLQRYSPRRARSLWSQINREHVARLTDGRAHAARRAAAGRRGQDRRAMGCRVCADAQRLAATIPDDLRTAIEANPRAQKTFRTLGAEPLRARVSHEQHEDAGRRARRSRGSSRCWRAARRSFRNALVRRARV